MGHGRRHRALVANPLEELPAFGLSLERARGLHRRLPPGGQGGHLLALLVPEALLRFRHERLEVHVHLPLSGFALQQEWRAIVRCTFVPT